MKRGPQQREKKALSAAGLLTCAREEFDQIPNHKRDRTLSLTDCLMSALAILHAKDKLEEVPGF